MVVIGRLIRTPIRSPLPLSFGDELVRVALAVIRRIADQEVPIDPSTAEGRIVNKHAVPDLRGNHLQGSAIRFPKTSLRHRVLIGKEAVIGIQPELMPALHGSSEDQARRACER